VPVEPPLWALYTCSHSRCIALLLAGLIMTLTFAFVLGPALYLH